MSFFNYEILQFLIEGNGSKGDKAALATYLRQFTEFCKRHVFEVPFTTYSNGNQVGCRKMKQIKASRKGDRSLQSSLLDKKHS